MRGSGRAFVAGLVLTFCAAAGTASAVEKEPVSGGLLTLPGYAAPASSTPAPREAPAPATTGESGGQGDTAWGVLVRGGYFSLWDGIADELFVEHPELTGWNVGAEIRYHGEGGGRGIASVGLAIDSVSVSAKGDWQHDETDPLVAGEGEVRMLAISLTGYLNLFPSWYVHPYVGLGLGVALATGHYTDETQRVDADYFVPVVHVPVGLAVELSEGYQLAIEARFNDGLAIGGALQMRF
jgi:hypothetical protein